MQFDVHFKLVLCLRSADAAGAESLFCVYITEMIQEHPSGSVRSTPGSYKVLRESREIPALYANNGVCISI